MIVRCVLNKVSEILDPRIRQHVQESVHLENIGLTVGEEYHVIGLLVRFNFVWLYLCDEPNANYPKPYCSVFFQMVDSCIPVGWKLLPEESPIIVPSAWAGYPQFLERLVDGDPDARAVFSEIKSEHTGQSGRSKD